jgi:hypothetical protein
MAFRWLLDDLDVSFPTEKTVQFDIVTGIDEIVKLIAQPGLKKLSNGMGLGIASLGLANCRAADVAFVVPKGVKKREVEPQLLIQRAAAECFLGCAITEECANIIPFRHFEGIVVCFT